jgi:hypothetical protein
LDRIFFVKYPFKATIRGNPYDTRTFKPNDSVWWDQVSDLVVFQADKVQFEADRAELLSALSLSLFFRKSPLFLS